MGIKRFLAGAALALFAAGAQAAPIGYATDTNGDLYTVDFGTGTATLVGSTGQFFEGIARAPNGALYGTTSGGVLYSISSATGAATLIGDTGLGNIEGLDFNGNTLLGTNFAATPSVYSIDVTTGAATLIATADAATGLVRSMTVLDANTILIRGDNNGNTLFSMDLGTGAITTIGIQPDFIYGMDFLGDGNLYGLSSNGLVFSINAGTGALTQIGDTGDQFWLTLAAADAVAVPLPGTLVLIAAGMAGLALRRRTIGI